MKLFYIFTTLLGYLLSSTLTFADTKITYKSAKSTSSYYQMGVQIAEAMKKNSIYNFINSLKLFGIGQSWGGFESLALYQSHVIQRVYRKYLKPNHHIVRFHIGLEDSKDLIEDLGKAIKKIKWV